MDYQRNSQGLLVERAYFVCTPIFQYSAACLRLGVVGNPSAVYGSLLANQAVEKGHKELCRRQGLLLPCLMTLVQRRVFS